MKQTRLRSASTSARSLIYDPFGWRWQLSRYSFFANKPRPASSQSITGSAYSGIEAVKMTRVYHEATWSERCAGMSRSKVLRGRPREIGKDRNHGKVAREEEEGRQEEGEGAAEDRGNGRQAEGGVGARRNAAISLVGRTDQVRPGRTTETIQQRQAR